MTQPPTSTPDFTDDDPPLGHCPHWCEKPPEHDWEDGWKAGPVRFHTWRRQIAKYHAIAVEEIEQYTAGGTTRRREIVLDVQAHTPWDIPTAQKALQLIVEALAIATNTAACAKSRVPAAHLMQAERR